jgi:predicted nucleic acid-binding protein
MIRNAQAVYVDTGAWIALALTKDPYHDRAREIWTGLSEAGARLHSSVSVVIETFTFLDRQTTRDVAVAWRQSLERVPRFRVWPVTPRDLGEAWAFFDRSDLHKLSAVDAVSFVLMRRAKIRAAFAFDHHFAAAGFRLLG